MERGVRRNNFGSIKKTLKSANVDLFKLKYFKNSNVFLDKKKLEKVCSKMQSTPIHLDLNNTKEIYKLLSKIKVDILVSNAGIGKGINGLIKSSKEEIEISTKVNFESHLHVLRCVIPNMVKKRKGHIVLMGSLAGL